MFSMTYKIVNALLMMLILLICCGSIYQYIAESIDIYKYPPIGTMVDIGGYKLHMIDSISMNKIQQELEHEKPVNFGKAIVVIDSGLMVNSFDWFAVQSKIAKFARVITYDRAGYAWSDVSPLARTSENIIEELRTMLKNVGVSGPYILVGHSFGGMNMRLFASKYPDEVAGVVLVDASHEDGFEKMPIDPIFDKKLLRFAAAITYLGIRRIINFFYMINENLNQRIENYPFDIQHLYKSQKTTTKFVNAVVREMFLMKENCKLVQLHGGLLGSKPLTVIAAGKPFTLESVSYCLSQKQLDESNKGWPELQANLVTKSLQGKQLVAENSGHNIHRDQPEIIVEAVRNMIEALN